MITNISSGEGVRRDRWRKHLVQILILFFCVQSTNSYLQ